MNRLATWCVVLGLPVIGVAMLYVYPHDAGITRDGTYDAPSSTARSEADRRVSAQPDLAPLADRAVVNPVGEAVNADLASTDVSVEPTGTPETLEEKYAGKTLEELMAARDALRLKFHARSKEIIAERRAAGMVNSEPKSIGVTAHYGRDTATSEDKVPRPAMQPYFGSVRSRKGSTTRELTTVPYGEYADHDALGAETAWLIQECFSRTHSKSR